MSQNIFFSSFVLDNIPSSPPRTFSPFLWLDLTLTVLFYYINKLYVDQACNTVLLYLQGTVCFQAPLDCDLEPHSVVEKVR